MDDDNHHDHHDHDGHEHGDTFVLPGHWIVVLGIICVLGLLGNAVACLVFARSDVRPSTRYILLALTFFDALLLLSYLTTFILYAIFPYDGRHSHEHVGWFYWLHTQFLHPISQTAYTGSVYAIVLVTFERYVAVCWPLLLNHLFTPRVSLGAVVALALFAVLVNSPRWLEMLPVSPVRSVDEATGEAKEEWEQLHHNDAYVHYYHGVFWISAMYAIPFLFLAVFNFLIWKEVRATNAKRAQVSTARTRAEISVTMMLLTVVGVFVLCNAVNCVLLVVMSIAKGEHHAYNVGIVVSIPLILNSSVNILIYCAKGQAFRTQLRKLVRPMLECVRGCCKAGDVWWVRVSGGGTTSSEAPIHSQSGTSINFIPFSLRAGSEGRRGPKALSLTEFPAMTPYVEDAIRGRATEPLASGGKKGDVSLDTSGLQVDEAPLPCNSYSS